jgi:hypothetical protein
MLHYALGGSVLTLIPFYKFVNFGPKILSKIAKNLIGATILIAPYVYAHLAMRGQLIQVKKQAFE